MKKRSAGPQAYIDGNPWAQVWKRLIKNKLAVAGIVFLLTAFVLCALAPFLTPYRYDAMRIGEMRGSPSASHPFGTDVLGRDMLTRVLYGGRVTYTVSFGSMILAAFIGGTLGMVSGYFGKWVDLLVMRLMDTLSSIPVILLTVSILCFTGMKAGNLAYALTIAAVPSFVRMARVSVQEVMGREYIEAARGLGIGHLKIMLTHVLPNIAAPMAVHFVGSVSDAMLSSTAIGFMGLAVNPPTPEWGQMIFDAREYILSRPFLILGPGLAVVFSVLAVNLTGSGLRDALDPRISER